MASRNNDSKYKFQAKTSMLPKPNTKMIIGLFVVVIALIAIWAVNSSRTNEVLADLNVPNISTSDSCKSDDCLLQLAKTSDNPSICELLNSTETQQKCFEQLATAHYEACEKVTDYDKRKECALSNAALADSVAPCQKLGLTEEDKRKCIISVDGCYYMNGTGQDQCRALSKGNYSYCNGEFDCVLEYAIANKDETSCSGTTGISSQYACVSIVLGRSVCSELPVQAEKDYCYEIYSKETDNVALCREITEGTDYQWRCYANTAIRTGQASQCENVELLNRWTCYRNYSVSTNDVSGCKAIHDLATNAKIGCFLDIARVYGNPSACENINSSSQKGMCYQLAVYNHEQPVIAIENCYDVRDESWRNACYTEVAKYSGDGSICTKYIEGEQAQGICERRVQNLTIIIEE